MGQSNTRNFLGGVGQGGVGVQAGNIGHLTIQHGAADEGSGEPSDPWVETVLRSPLWRHVPEGRDVEPFREAAGELVSALVPLRDRAEGELHDDPWLDPGMPLRFHDRSTELLGSPGQAEDLDLYPAEAALLAFIPFLFRVHEMRRAATRVDIGPGSLKAVEAPSPGRRSFEALVSEYPVLVERALRTGRNERDIGWWLFHRWLLKAENSTGVDDLWSTAPEVLRRFWKAGQIRHLLHGLRLGPGICNPEHLEDLRQDEYLPSPGGEQHLRERRLALILALGFAMALETSSLPETVLEHLAIPEPVDPEELRETVERAFWGSDRHLLTLNAECSHEAVIEGLREHVGRADELLHGVHRTLRSHVANLPSRLSSDRVEPVEGGFESWARFRIDERRARELLAGERLYKKRDLAIRELYQNSLDACRYRRARTEYLNRRSPLASFGFEGRIEFTQGTDESGRVYVDCRDNGVGMGENELRGVFSRAGSRFAEQADFLQERERWEREDPPIRLYPNSRFGIGVLSYFMLADEIRVTTCRMGADGSLGPELEAVIHGPGHLFRITRTGRSGTAPGTLVRLYLKKEIGEYWSCVDALSSVLVLAEFETTARGGRKEKSWEPGAPDTSSRNFSGTATGDGGGWQIPWREALEGVDVVWCEDFGSLLVDGLIVSPGVVRGVFDTGSTALDNVVVNLSGSHAPKALSIDRSVVLSDVSDQVLGLIQGSVRAFSGSPVRLWNDDWFLRTVRKQHLIGDSLSLFSTHGEQVVPGQGRRLCTGRNGYVPLDAALLGMEDGNSIDSWFTEVMDPGETYPLEAGFLLWRLLAVGEGEVVEELFEMTSGLPEVRDLRAGRPTDQVLLLGESRLCGASLDSSLRKGEELGFSGRDVIQRWSDLGALPDSLTVECYQIAGLLSSAGVREMFSSGGVGLSGRARPTDLAQMVSVLDLAPSQVAEHARNLGADVSEEVEAEAETPHVEVIRKVIYEEMGWNRRMGDIPPSLFSVSESLGLSLEGLCALLVRLECGGLLDVLVKRALLDLCFDDSLSTPEAAEICSGLVVFLSRDSIKYNELLGGRSKALGMGGAFERLNLFGLESDLSIPDDMNEVERFLVEDIKSLGLWGFPVGGKMPLASVLVAEQKHGIEASSMIEALRRLGVPVSAERLPEDLSRADAITLISQNPGREHFSSISPNRPLALSHLVIRAQRMGVSLERVMGWYRDLGYRPPMLERLLPVAVRHIPLK
ncbi:HD domain-containing protein [Nocardiopsis alba]|uniref:HD domain-containing protein n=1 Tax=Nocardiopsis alba TaxID=53437 RepID=UPI0033B234BE